MLMTGKELVKCINENPDKEYVIEFTGVLKTDTPMEKPKKRVILYNPGTEKKGGE